MPAFRGSYWVLLGAVSVACGGSAGDHGASGGASHVPCAACTHTGGGGNSAAGGALDAGLGGSTDDAGVSAAGAAGEVTEPPVDDGVAISEISFWQAMRVPLELAGKPAEAQVPIILGKEGILRVYVAPGSAFRARQLTAALQFGSSPGSAPLTSSKVIRALSADGDFSTTFNFPIDAPSVVADAGYSVVLQDGENGPVLGRYPAVGQSPLSPVTAGKTLNVVVVPMVVEGMMPDVSAHTLATFRSRVLSIYPLADLTISAHAPISSNVVVGPDVGWDQLLDALYALRAKDAPADNVYYFGMFTPTKRFADYCVTDCTVGLSNVAAPDEVESRGSIGLGIFSDGSDSDAPDTMAHELGHALGRQHSPCGGATGVDRHYPYKDGKIGVWGFDSLNHLLLDPTVYGDVMGYCSPAWISDYTYGAIFDRVQHVNAGVAGAQALRFEVAAGVYRRVLVGAHGELHWGSFFTPSADLTGEARPVELLARDGHAVGVATGYFRAFSDALGGFLAVRSSVLDASAGISAIRVGTAELSLSAPMP